MIATPTLASDAAGLMWRILERDLDGIFHCCGGESVDRRTLALRAAQVFELDPTLLDLRVAPPAAAIPAQIPYDTSLDAKRTAAVLDVELPGVTEMLERMCRELAPA
jgi:dTDP-4-dehydrorhamnose reductase